MNSKVRPRQEEVAEERTPEQEAAIKGRRGLVGQFARTLKTCRLYDAANPTVVRFRQETETSLRRTLEALGTLVLKFTADDVLYEGALASTRRARATTTWRSRSTATACARSRSPPTSSPASWRRSSTR